MLEIILLVFLSRNISKLARSKGLRPTTWNIYLVTGWIFSEGIGIVVGLMIFGANNLISVALLAFGFAISSYYFLHWRLRQYPDIFEDDIDNIGQ